MSTTVVRFPGGKRVDAEHAGFTIRTDQPAELDGEGTAPTPFDLFLASIATCAGIYVKGFCNSRRFDTRAPGTGFNLWLRSRRAAQCTTVRTKSMSDTGLLSYTDSRSRGIR